MKHQRPLPSKGIHLSSWSAKSLGIEKAEAAENWEAGRDNISVTAIREEACGDDGSGNGTQSACSFITH